MKVTNARAAELTALSAKAFRGPWRYAEFEIDCEECDNPRPIIEVSAPEQYPESEECPQCVAQQEFSISVPGIGSLADANGAFIVAARNTIDDLLADREEMLNFITWLSSFGDLPGTLGLVSDQAKRILSAAESKP